MLLFLSRITNMDKSGNVGISQGMYGGVVETVDVSGCVMASTHKLWICKVLGSMDKSWKYDYLLTKSNT